MIHQWVSLEVRRRLRRAIILVAAVLWFSLSTSPAGHADESGLLDDPTHDIVDAATQVVEPVVQTAEPAVQQPVEQVVEPAVQQAVEPAVTAAAQPVKQAVKPVVRLVEPAVHQAVEPEVHVTDPAVESAPVSVAPQAPITGGPDDGHTGDVSGHSGTQPVDDGGTKGTADRQRDSATAGRTSLTDLAPRARGGREMSRVFGTLDDPSADPALWTLTNSLMQLWADEQVPGAINAGLPGGATSAPTPWTAPPLLGLLLCSLSLVVAWRRLT